MGRVRADFKTRDSSRSADDGDYRRHDGDYECCQLIRRARCVRLRRGAAARQPHHASGYGAGTAVNSMAGQNIGVGNFKEWEPLRGLV